MTIARRPLSLIVPVAAIFALLTASASLTSAHAGSGLLEARAGHKTSLRQRITYPDPPLSPPLGTLKLVKYRSPAGDLAAYVTPGTGDGRKRPAIVWLIGGFDNGIDYTAWAPADVSDDQSASVFRERGIVTMYPSLRGGNGNPGQVESFYGEVEDVLAAGRYLAAQPYVDPNRVYLGGHSTGGTLALLAAEATDQFRAVFSFGPASEASRYDADSVAFDVNDAKEARLRSPVNYLGAIRTPTLIIEGRVSPSNLVSIRELRRQNPPAAVSFVEVDNADHFSVLAPLSSLLAQKILADTAAEPNFSISYVEATNAMNTCRRSDGRASERCGSDANAGTRPPQ